MAEGGEAATAPEASASTSAEFGGFCKETRCWSLALMAVVPDTGSCTVPLHNKESNAEQKRIIKRLPQQPVASTLRIEPTEEEIATAMKAMANEKAVGPDGL
ncbi:unnamed protein product, partial [Ascophyllum nodosum]